MYACASTNELDRSIWSLSLSFLPRLHPNAYSNETIEHDSMCYENDKIDACRT
jgi:hypothetical protein